jgi:hypothetical protein
MKKSEFSLLKSSIKNDSLYRGFDEKTKHEVDSAIELLNPESPLVIVNPDQRGQPRTQRQNE